MPDYTQYAKLLLNNLMKNMPDNIFFKDTKSRFIMVNRAYCEWTGMTAESFVGKSDFDLFAKEHAQKTYDDEQRIIATGEPMIGLEEEEVWPDGSVTWVSTTKMPLLNEEGEIIGTFGISRDISSRKRIENQLKEAHKNAEHAALTKSLFLANMSHEIRTPLNAMVGMSGLLADTPLNAEQQDFVGMINTSSEALLKIVNDILDLSKIETGKFELESVPFDLVQTVENAVDLMAQRAAEKSLELMLCFRGTMPKTVIGDALRLRQTLLNLLNNAIKFTPQGEILVEVESAPLDDQHYTINCLVSDTGIGMTEEETKRIFKPFEQADVTVTRKYGGTGLGLSISKKLIELMGGEMTVRSKTNVGSEFRFQIELRKSDDETLPLVPVESEILNGCRVLVVDDNATNLKILEYELAIAKMVPLTFTSGEDALKQLDTLAPDIAILDYSEPNEDGTTLAEELKARPEFGNRPILILCLGGGARNATRDSSYRWMSKPIKARKLYESLADLLGSEMKAKKIESAASMAPPSNLARHYPHKILLVEDNKVNQMVTLKMLSKMGYEADLAENGQKAVEAASTNSYDLILMDIQMPVMDGLEATRIIRRQNGSITNPMIVGLSAHAMKESRDEALRTGMNHYLSKPVKMQDLMQMLKEV